MEERKQSEKFDYWYWVNAVDNNQIKEINSICEKYHETESKLKLVLENTSEGIVILDKNLTYTFWNKAEEKLTDIKKEEVLGKTVEEAFPGFEKSDFYKMYQRILESGKPEEMTADFTLPNGKTKTYLDRVYPYGDGLIMFVQVV